MILLALAARRLAEGTIVLYAGAVILVVLAQHIVPQRDGWLALTEAAEPYLFLPVVCAVPFALRRAARITRLAAAACGLLWCTLYLPAVLPLLRPAAAPPGETALRVRSWNIFFFNPHRAELPAIVAAFEADVVLLQELAGVDAARLDGDPDLARRFPGRVFSTVTPGFFGQGLLSAYPVLAQGTSDEPRIAWARLDLGAGRTLRVVNFHAYPADVQMVPVGGSQLPTGIFAAARDAQFPSVRALIDPWLAAGEPVLLAGDFNVTEREMGYRELAAGLQDAYLVAGTGFGNTWGPADMPLLRIDYMFAGPGVTSMRLRADCTPRGSDHCSTEGTFIIGR